MTSREKGLLTIMLWVAAASGFLVVAGLYLDRVSELDSVFVKLQKEALRIQTQSEVPLSQQTESETWLLRFWAPGTLPQPLDLARTVSPELTRFGVRIKGVEVVGATEKRFTLRYTLDSTMPAFLKANSALSEADPKFIVWKLSGSLSDHDTYLLSWEIGYVTTP